MERAGRGEEKFWRGLEEDDEINWEVGCDMEIGF